MNHIIKKVKSSIDLSTLSHCQKVPHYHNKIKHLLFFFKKIFYISTQNNANELHKAFL